MHHYRSWLGVDVGCMAGTIGKVLTIDIGAAPAFRFGRSYTNRKNPVGAAGAEIQMDPRSMNFGSNSSFFVQRHDMQHV